MPLPSFQNLDYEKLYLLKHPETFAKVAFCAPMFGIQPALPTWLSKTLGHTHVGINKLFSAQPWYFPGQGKYDAEPFDDNVLTQCALLLYGADSRLTCFRRMERCQNLI